MSGNTVSMTLSISMHKFAKVFKLFVALISIQLNISNFSEESKLVPTEHQDFNIRRDIPRRGAPTGQQNLKVLDTFE